MPRSLVTGGSGFIGSHVVDELLRAGHDVSVLDSGTGPHRPDVEFLDVDLVDSGAVVESVAGHDYVFHLAAVSDVNHAQRDPVHCAQVNVVGTVNVLEAARRNEVSRIVLASSVFVYSGLQEGTLEEGSSLNPPTVGPFYSTSKIAAEFFCHDYWRIFGQEFTILRYGTAYGPRMRAPQVIHNFITKANAGQPITILGDGSQFRNFVYVEDLARAHSLALTDKGINQTYNLDGAAKITIRETADTIVSLLGRNVKIEHKAARSESDAGIGASIAKAEAELGWSPAIGFEEGIRRTIDWYRKIAPPG